SGRLPEKYLPFPSLPSCLLFARITFSSSTVSHEPFHLKQQFNGRRRGELYNNCLRHAICDDGKYTANSRRHGSKRTVCLFFREFASFFKNFEYACTNRMIAVEEKRSVAISGKADHGGMKNRRIKKPGKCGVIRNFNHFLIG